MIGSKTSCDNGVTKRAKYIPRGGRTRLPYYVDIMGLTHAVSLDRAHKNAIIYIISISRMYIEKRERFS